MQKQKSQKGDGRVPVIQAYFLVEHIFHAIVAKKNARQIIGAVREKHKHSVLLQVDVQAHNAGRRDTRAVRQSVGTKDWSYAGS